MTTDLQDFIAAHIQQIQIEIGTALVLLCGPEPEEALTAMAQARVVADALEARLVAEGFDMSQGQQREWFSLTSLPMMSSPKAVALLAGIDALLPMAKELDTERGIGLPENSLSHSGGSWGTKYTEDLATMRLRLFSEISGARGRGLE